MSVWDVARPEKPPFDDEAHDRHRGKHEQGEVRGERVADRNRRDEDESRELRGGGETESPGDGRGYDGRVQPEDEEHVRELLLVRQVEQVRGGREEDRDHDIGGLGLHESSEHPRQSERQHRETQDAGDEQIQPAQRQARREGDRHMKEVRPRVKGIRKGLTCAHPRTPRLCRLNEGRELQVVQRVAQIDEPVRGGERVREALQEGEGTETKDRGLPLTGKDSRNGHEDHPEPIDPQGGRADRHPKREVERQDDENPDQRNEDGKPVTRPSLGGRIRGAGISRDRSSLHLR